MKLNLDSQISFPNSVFNIIWSISFSLIILLYFSLALMSITFQTTAVKFFNSVTVTFFMLVICILDTVVSLHIATIQNGKLIRHKKNNLKRYYKMSIFYIDQLVLIILILRIIFQVIGVSQNVITVLNLFIVLKFYNIYLHQKRLKFYYFREHTLLIFEFCKYLLLLGFLCHVVACIFFYIDALLIEAEWYPIQQHWLIISTAMDGIYYQPLDIQYLYSFYFSLVTLSTIAYGDITPMNPTQTSFVVFLQSFLLLLYAYIFTKVYEIITWFNREEIRIRQDKIKMVHYLDKYQSWIDASLKGRILAEYQYRNRNQKRTNKDLFAQDLSHTVQSSYHMAQFRFEASRFMPNFIKRAFLPSHEFNSIISQKFLVPDSPFQSLVNKGNKITSSDRQMFYVSSTKILRRLKLPNYETLNAYAEDYRWLGVNNFITGQIDSNEDWTVEFPVQLLCLKFNELNRILKKSVKSYEIFTQECHRTLYWGGASQDMQKCLLCGKQYHSSLYCQEYNPIKKLSEIHNKMELCQNQRDQTFKRQATPFNVKQLIRKTHKKDSKEVMKNQNNQSIQVSFLNDQQLDEQTKQPSALNDSYNIEIFNLTQYKNIPYLTQEINSNYEIRQKQRISRVLLQKQDEKQRYASNIQQLRLTLSQINNFYSQKKERKTYINGIAADKHIDVAQINSKVVMQKKSSQSRKLQRYVRKIKWRKMNRDSQKIWAWAHYMSADNITK